MFEQSFSRNTRGDIVDAAVVRDHATNKYGIVLITYTHVEVISVDVTNTIATFQVRYGLSPEHQSTSSINGNAYTGRYQIQMSDGIVEMTDIQNSLLMPLHYEPGFIVTDRSVITELYDDAVDTKPARAS